MDTWLVEARHILNGSSYEQWCDECLFDPNEERSHRLYEQAERLAGYLEVFLGPHLTEFLYGH